MFGEKIKQRQKNVDKTGLREIIIRAKAPSLGIFDIDIRPVRCRSIVLVQYTGTNPTLDTVTASTKHALAFQNYYDSSV